eukprot:jgi/Astpho2/2379/fgenesh1_pg.00044_%23_27_t
MWGHLTCPQAWLTASAASPLQPCPTYRKLYQLLRQWQQLQGVWRINDCSRVLVVFSWAPDCITATRLTYGDQEAATLEPQASPLLCVGPAHSNTLVDLYGAQHCSISVTQGGSPSSAKFDAAVEAAAAVAVGSIPIPGRRESSGGSPLGGSPQGSFEYEMMRFMQGNVAGSKGKRRRSGRGQRASQKGKASQVALCYQGKGSCAWTMGYPSTSCEGRLWQYSDGTLGFLWIHPVHGERIVDYARLDGDLELARH